MVEMRSVVKNIYGDDESGFDVGQVYKYAGSDEARL